MMDTRYAYRTLIANPSFTITAALTLALGIGLNTAVFSVVDAVMLRPLPYRRPSELVTIGEQLSLPGGRSLTGLPLSKITEYRKTRALLGPCLAIPQEFTLTGQGLPIRVMSEAVTNDFFNVLSVSPVRGRTFLPEEYQLRNERVVAISYALWTGLLNADAGVLGRALTLDGEPYIVVGILPRDFTPPDQFTRSERIDLYVPAAFSAAEMTTSSAYLPGWFCRLRPNVSVAQATAILQAIVRAPSEAGPLQSAPRTIVLRSLGEELTRNVSTSMWVLLGAVDLVLLIACVNVAHLLMVRASARHQEIAIRAALGATRLRLLRQLLIEAAVIGVAGSILGGFLCYSAVHILVGLPPVDIPRLSLASINIHLLTYTIMLTATTVVLFGMIPAWRLSSNEVFTNALRTGRNQQTNVSFSRLRATLITGEVALSLMLLVGAGLLLKSFSRLNAVTLGFEPRHVLTMDVALSQNRYSDPVQRMSFFEKLAAEIEQIPGVKACSYAARLPLRGPGFRTIVGTDDAPILDARRTDQNADLQVVGPRYFQTLGIALHKGRDLEGTDRSGSQPVVVVNESLVNRYFLGRNAVGEHVRLSQAGSWYTIVGVVGDTRFDGQAREVRPQVFVAATQADPKIQRAISEIAVRADVSPGQLTRAIQRILLNLDREVPLTHVQTLERLVSKSIDRRRFEAVLMQVFAVVALSLALVGLYGVIAYTVSQRSAEIGLRIALGAQPLEVVGQVLGRSLRYIAIGLIIGLLGGFAIGRILKSILFSVHPTDWTVYALATFIMTAVSIVASYIPAWRVSQFDPTSLMRDQ